MRISNSIDKPKRAQSPDDTDTDTDTGPVAACAVNQHATCYIHTYM